MSNRNSITERDSIRVKEIAMNFHRAVTALILRNAAEVTELLNSTKAPNISQIHRFCTSPMYTSLNEVVTYISLVLYVLTVLDLDDADLLWNMHFNKKASLYDRSRYTQNKHYSRSAFYRLKQKAEHNFLVMIGDDLDTYRLRPFF